MVKGNLLALLIMSCVEHKEVMILKSVRKLHTKDKKLRVQ